MIKAVLHPYESGMYAGYEQAAVQKWSDNGIARNRQAIAKEISRSQAELAEPVANSMRYTRLFSDEQGESHFDEVELEFASTDYVESSAPLRLSPAQAAADYRFMDAPAGWTSDWHPSSARNLFVVLSGEWEVTASDGETRRFKTEDILFVEDTTGKGHASRVVSDENSVAVMIKLSE
jgi:quercetin dioxygenase-like cupin family protein